MPQHESLEILYQDEWIVAVNKPAGHLVHPAEAPKEDDQVTMKILRDQIAQRVYSIHRIDRPTTGVLLFGIDREVAKSLHGALEKHQMQKIYWAVASGLAPDEPWECREPIQKHNEAPIREAHTSFCRLDYTSPDCLKGTNRPTLSLIEARPHTGRFHQIRRHLLHHDLPIAGDYRYAGIEQSDALGSLLGTGTRMLLQSKSLSFIHPITAEDTLIEAPVDSEFLKCFPSL